MAAVFAVTAVLGTAASAVHAATDERKTTVSVALPTDPLLVQLNQVALERTGPKRAVVESTGAAQAGRYRVLSGGKTVAEGELKPLPDFSAWGAGRRYFEADFSAVQTPGVYRIEATLDGRRVTSAPVRVRDQALFSITADKLLDYFHRSRHTGKGDRRIRIFETDRFVDVRGGWKDAGGDTGKYLSHLGFANFFNPQQTSMAAWALAYTADSSADLYRRAGLLKRAQDEAFWGADYLHRILDAEGYFYTTVFDKWGAAAPSAWSSATKAMTALTKLYRSAYRAGGGMAIAALARASLLAKQSGAPRQLRREDLPRRRGEGLRPSAAVQRAVHRQRRREHHRRLHRADGRGGVVQRDEGSALPRRGTRARRQPDAAPGGRRQFISDGGTRPYYHAVEAGLPALSLGHYLDIETDDARRSRATTTIKSALQHEVDITRRVSNPSATRGGRSSSAKDGKAEGPVLEGFFIPHRNETGYWWQGERAAAVAEHRDGGGGPQGLTRPARRLGRLRAGPGRLDAGAEPLRHLDALRLRQAQPADGGVERGRHVRRRHLQRHHRRGRQRYRRRHRLRPRSRRRAMALGGAVASAYDVDAAGGDIDGAPAWVALGLQVLPGPPHSALLSPRSSARDGRRATSRRHRPSPC